MIEINSFRPLSVKRSSAAADDTSTCSPASAVPTARRTCADDAPSLAPTRIESYASPLPSAFCAVSRSKTANVAVPSDLTSPNVATPTTS
jgi:hypothetical protein